MESGNVGIFLKSSDIFCKLSNQLIDDFNSYMTLRFLRLCFFIPAAYRFILLDDVISRRRTCDLLTSRMKQSNRQNDSKK